MKKNVALGFVPSKMDGSEHEFKSSVSVQLPSTYSYRDFLSKILDQGAAQICVPCSISAYLNWKENIKNGSKRDNKIDLFQIYDIRTNQGDGMSFKDAFRFLRHTGVNSKVGNLKINEYARLNSISALKSALVMNGPCVGALAVYSTKPKFWEQHEGEELIGYHAISIVGYDEEGFIIRNSWGTGFGDKGYTKLNYNEFDNLFELWTIL